MSPENLETIRIVTDVALLPVIAAVGWLVRRAINGFDLKLDALAADLKTNTGRTVELEKDMAVLKYRIRKLDGGGD